MKLSTLLSIVEGPEGRGLEVRLTNAGDTPVTLSEVWLSLGRKVRSVEGRSDQWQVTGIAMNTPFVLDAPRTLAPGQDTVVIMPPASANGLDLLAQYINEDVAIRVTVSGGEVVKINDEAIRATVARLMELQNPALQTRLKLEVLRPRRSGDGSDGAR